MEVSTFTCSICADPSRDICIYCTKDACSNHLCERCRRCSDCCNCEMPVFNLPNGHKKDMPVVAATPHVEHPAEDAAPES